MLTLNEILCNNELFTSTRRGGTFSLLMVIWTIGIVGTPDRIIGSPFEGPQIKYLESLPEYLSVKLEVPGLALDYYFKNE